MVDFVPLTQVKSSRRLITPLVAIGGKKYEPWIEASRVYLMGIDSDLRLGARLSEDGERVVVFPRNGTIEGVYIQNWLEHPHLNLAEKVEEIHSKTGIVGVVIKATPHWTFAGEKRTDSVEVEIRYNPN